MAEVIYHDVSRFTDKDIYLFKAGNLLKAYEHLGAHRMTRDGQEGVYFAVWAPAAEVVSVIGDFNYWSPDRHPLGVRWDSSGIWEGFIPEAREGHCYKYRIVSGGGKHIFEKKDPYAFGTEVPPKTASVVASLEHVWKDEKWMSQRQSHNGLDSPMSIYELHLASWMHNPKESRWLSYRELAEKLTDYVIEMGFTHVEFMPVMAHPFCGSWGYQVLGYFAPTSRFGSPQDLMFLIDTLHQNGIGVILDWVPAHFPSDSHGLVYFDGSCLYEHEDPRRGFHPDWKSCIFNYGRQEVKEFLISSAMFWLDKYHIDGLRVDGVASMLYLDYSREDGQWVANEHGGRENLDAIRFLQQLNEMVYRDFPDVQMIAEESTDWGGVSRPTFFGGLGFGLKWNMGWMHDALLYFSKEAVHRKYHHNELTFSMLYAYTENFVLSLSHDEVVHGKCSLIEKMPGDDWQKFANLRLLFTYMYAHPGKKLLFMGSEIAQRREWNYRQSLDWHLLDYEPHKGIQSLLKDLNRVYRRESALWAHDFIPEGFEWVHCDDWEQSILCFLRKGKTWRDTVLVVCNFTPVPRYHYRVGVPHGGFWKEIFNSDAVCYGGGGIGNLGGLATDDIAFHGRRQSLDMTIPPLAVVVFKIQPNETGKT